MEKVGMVGVGAMGSALLERLRLAGVEATAFDIAPSAMEAARALGARVAPSAAAVAEASTIIDCTATPGRVLRRGALSLDRLNEVLEPLGATITDEG